MGEWILLRVLIAGHYHLAGVPGGPHYVAAGDIIHATPEDAERWVSDGECEEYEPMHL